MGLTKDQKKIMKDLENEFLRINEANAPKSKGLIDVAGIINEVNQKNIFIQECEAERSAYAKKVDGIVRADMEKIKADLLELGITVKLHDKATNASYFGFCDTNAINEGSLMWVDYQSNRHIEKTKFGHTEKIPTEHIIKFRFKNLSSGRYDDAFYNTIEDMVAHDIFKKMVKYHYEQILSKR